MRTSALQRDLVLVFLLALGTLVAGGDWFACIATQLVMSAALIACWFTTR